MTIEKLAVDIPQMVRVPSAGPCVVHQIITRAHPLLHRVLRFAGQFLSHEQHEQGRHARSFDGFRAVAGEVDAQRLALYIVHRRLGRVARTACALRPDAEERAAPRLEELQSPLDRLASP